MTINWLKFILYAGAYYIASLILRLVIELYSSSPFLFADESYYLLDKILLYCFVFYPPYVISALIIKYLFQCPYASKIAIVIYTIHCTDLFVTERFQSRGMEVESKALYLLLLYTPVIMATCLEFRKHFRNSRLSNPN